MLLRLSVFLFAFNTSTSLAQEHPRFYKPQDLPKEALLDSGVLDRALKATVLLWTKNSNSAFAPCSAEFISKDGYLITAAHCIRNAHEIWPQLKVEQNTRGELTWLSVGIQTPKNVSIRHIVLQNKDVHTAKLGRSFYTGPAKVVFIGRGMPILYPRTIQALEALKDEDFKAMREGTEDFVVLKIDFPAGTTTSCLSVNPYRQPEGTPIWLVGYPEASEKRFSDGNGLFVSFGSIVNPEEAFDNPSIAKTLDFDVYMSTSAISFYRSSGGSAINQNGALLGIASSGHILGSELIRGSEIVWQIKKLLGDQRAAEIFNCE